MDTFAPRSNPYVGPRAFQTGERLYARDRDILNLYYLLLAERVVLLFSPSGAGKTSLIQAGLIPRLGDKFGFMPVVRVNHDPPENIGREKKFNRYIFSVLVSLEETLQEEKRLPVEELAEIGLSEYLAQRFQAEAENLQPDEQGKPKFEALIFDQFEEILTTAPNDYEGKRAFFEQIGEALRDNKRWALFSTREDYVAAFEPYLPAIPTRFANRYRLDLLGAEAAIEAIQRPAHEAGVDFVDTAARQLIDDLRRVQIQRPDGTLEPDLGRYVEPVQLQVVCYRLWQDLAEDETEITERHISTIGSVDESLSGYYAEQVEVAEERFKVPLRNIREWFNDKLITKQGTRSQVMLEPDKSGGLDNRVIRFMEAAHLVRGEKRAGSTWFELAHDRLIGPIRTDNEKWLAANLSLLQQQANLWNRQDRPASLLLSERELVHAREWAEEHKAELLPSEVYFLEASLEREERALRRKRLYQVITLLGIAAIVLAVIAFLNFRKANFLYQEAQRQERIARSGQLAALSSQAALEGFPQRSLLLAIEANSVIEVADGKPASAEEALRASLKDLRGLPLLGHEGQVNSLAISADGRWLVTGGQDGVAHLWDLHAAPTSVSPQILSGHEGGISVLTISPDGRWLATGGEDRTVRLWDLNSSNLNRQPIVLRGHEGSIFTLAFSPDGRWLATGSEDGTARLWSLATPTLSEAALVLTSLDGWIQTLAFSPDGRWLATAGPHTVWLWHLNAPDPAADPHVLPGHEALIQTLAFSPDGRWLASGSRDGTARLWDVSASERIPRPVVLRGHMDWVNALAFSPDGRWLATGSGDKVARLWPMSRLETSPNPILLPGHTAPIKTLAFSPDGRTLATGGQDHTIRLWDVSAVAPAVNPQVLQGHDGWVNVLAFSPEGRWLATGSQDGGVRLWDRSSTGTAVNPLVLGGQKDDVNVLAFSPDGRWLATGSADHTARLWDLQAADLTTGQLELRGHTSWIQVLAFSPDGRWLATGGGDSAARLWDLNAANPATDVIILSGHGGEIKTLAFSSDWRWLATGSADRTVLVWDLNVEDPSANPIALSGHQGDINVLSFSPDGRWLVTGSADNIARLWDITAPDPLTTQIKLIGHQDDILALAFSPDGRWLATGSGYLDPTVRLWNLQTSTVAEEPKTLSGHTGSISSLAFSPDGRWLATGSWDKTARLWDMRDGEPDEVSVVLPGHEDWVNTLAFSPDGRWLATGSDDWTARLWNLEGPYLETNSVLLSGHEGGVNALAFSPDGRWLATGSADHTTRLWLVQLDDLKRLACRSTGRNFSHKEWEQYFPGESYRKTCEEWPDGP
jgi:WD40 repeat protein